LTQNPDYLAKVPEKLKSKAQKYIEVAAPAAADSTQASAATPAASTSMR
jgi:cytochrome c oxidase subunit 2